MPNSLDPDQARQNIRSDLDPNCLQMFSTDDTNTQRVKIKLRYTTLFFSLQILPEASQHYFECMHNIPESFPKSPSLWQLNIITRSKHCNFGTSSQVYTWHQTFYIIKHHAIIGEIIRICYSFTAFRSVCGVCSYPPPLPLP